jgi:hypothetical protein
MSARLLTRAALVVSLAVAVVGWYLPWVSNRAAALSANAPDLAEWVGVAPSQRAANPPMLAPFLLRFALAAAGVLFALRGRAEKGRVRAVLFIAGLILGLTLLPPPTYFASAAARDDINYQQLFALSVATLSATSTVFFARHAVPSARLWPLIEIGIALVAIPAALVGHAQAAAVITALGVPAPLGVGLVIMVGAYVGFVTARAWALIKYNRP